MPRFLALALAVISLGVHTANAAASSSAEYVPLPAPASGHVHGFKVSERRAVEVARHTAAVRRLAAQRGAALVPHPLVFVRSWVVNFTRSGRVVASVQLNGRTGAVEQVLSGRELTWPQIYHGVHSAQGHRVNFGIALLTAIFLLPFARPPFRRAHFDLLVLVSLEISFFIAAHGNVWLATPLLYPPLLYFVFRLVSLARSGGRDAGLDSWMPTRWLVVSLVLVLAGRYAYDAIDGFVSDVGYASLYGADSIKHGYDIYSSAPASGNLDTYGPFAYLAYVPFTLIIPFDLTRQAGVGAAQLGAIFFDLATVVGLVLVGRQIRDLRLGCLLAWGFAAFPLTFLPLTSNTNDALVAALLTWLLFVAASPAWRGLLLGLAAATKFAPVVLAGVFLRTGPGRGVRHALAYVGVAIATAGVLVFAYLPDGGLREFYDATLGFQFTRQSPFSMWGLHPSWQPAHVAVVVLAAGLTIAAIRVPRQRMPTALAAMGAAVIIAAQLTAIHWYWFYVPWFLPYLLVAVLSGPRSPYSSNAAIAKNGANHAT